MQLYCVLFNRKQFIVHKGSLRVDLFPFLQFATLPGAVPITLLPKVLHAAAEHHMQWSLRFWPQRSEDGFPINIWPDDGKQPRWIVQRRFQ